MTTNKGTSSLEGIQEETYMTKDIDLSVLVKAIVVLSKIIT
jgi:hypothetical protein